MVKAALESLPDGCVVEGVWRRTDYPPPIEHLKHTLVICESPAGRFVHTIYDNGANPNVVQLDELGRAVGTRADVYQTKPDGSLYIGDEHGEVITLPPS